MARRGQREDEDNGREDGGVPGSFTWLTWCMVSMVYKWLVACGLLRMENCTSQSLRSTKEGSR